jgi:Holliday junction resolvase RusA-like endonuclease
MTAPVSFFVAGEPKGQPRVKAFVRGKHAGVYDPGTADGWKLLVRSESTRVPHEPFAGPVMVALRFVFKRPNGHYVASDPKRERKATAPLYHTAKPDCDNAAKALLDALTNVGTYWHDDAQVASLTVLKQYTGRKWPTPGCAVVIETAP